MYYYKNMNKYLKISLITVSAITIIGGGYLLYKKLELYKDKSVRDEEEKYKTFGQIVEFSGRKLPKVYNWYNGLTTSHVSLVEKMFYSLTDSQKEAIRREFKNGELSSTTISMLNKLGYNN